MRANATNVRSRRTWLPRWLSPAAEPRREEVSWRPQPLPRARLDVGLLGSAIAPPVMPAQGNLETAMVELKRSGAELLQLAVRRHQALSRLLAMGLRTIVLG